MAKVRTLFDAITENKLNEIRDLIKAGANLAEKNAAEKVPMEYALELKNWDAIDRIARYGKDNKDGNCMFDLVLTYAVKENRLSIVKVIISKPNPESKFDWHVEIHYCAHWAAKNDNVEMLELLAEYKCSMTRKSESEQQIPLEVAYNAGKWKAAQYLIDFEIKNAGTEKKVRPHFVKTLEMAVKNDKYFITNLLVNNGTPVTAIDNEHGSILLFHAVTNKNQKITDLLLESGADPRIRNDNGDDIFDLARKLEFTSPGLAKLDSVMPTAPQMTTALLTQSLTNQSTHKLMYELFSLRQQIMETKFQVKKFGHWVDGTPTHMQNIINLINQMDCTKADSIHQTYGKVLLEFNTATDPGKYKLNWFEETILKQKVNEQHETSKQWYASRKEEVQRTLLESYNQQTCTQPQIVYVPVDLSSSNSYTINVSNPPPPAYPASSISTNVSGGSYYSSGSPALYAVPVQQQPPQLESVYIPAEYQLQ